MENQEKKPLGHEFNFGALICEVPVAKDHGQRFHNTGKEDEPFLEVEIRHSAAQCAYYRDASNNHHTAVFRFDEPLEEKLFTEADKNREPDRGLGYRIYTTGIRETRTFYKDKEATAKILTINFPEGDVKDPTLEREVTATFYQDEHLRFSLVLTYATFLKRTDKSLLQEICDELKLLRKHLEETKKP